MDGLGEANRWPGARPTMIQHKCTQCCMDRGKYGMLIVYGNEYKRFYAVYLDRTYKYYNGQHLFSYIV